MKRFIPMTFRIVLAVLVLSCSAATAQQQAKVVKLAEIQDILSKQDGRVRVVNFWATWCGPCIAEMPLFEKLTAQNRPDVEVYLVSMDLDLDPNVEKVHKFVARKKLKSTVLIIDEPDPTSWIDKVDKEWSGALPATIVVNGATGKRKFIGKSVHEGDLERLIEEVK